MTAIFLCALAFVVAFMAGRKSLVAGLAATLSVGYAYGILRAQLEQAAAHFIFDAAVLGLYCAQWRQLAYLPKAIKALKLQRWMLLLTIWPAILLLVPVQDILVELVGLRGHIFFLPFILIGARITDEERYQFALWLAALNLAAFGFAVAEYFWGVTTFYPYREGVTTLVYMSKDLAGYTAHRIPATFGNAHAYAGTMVMTIPILFGAWISKHRSIWQSYLLAIALAASITGIFMAAARTHALALFVMLAVVTISGQMKLATQLGWVAILIAIGWAVSSEERLQRFTTLQDSQAVSVRVYGSLNEGFLKRALHYPMGNGLGGGGTSLPYFLQDKVKAPTVGIMENEYARIMLEQGVPGLCIWIAFLAWLFTRRFKQQKSSWSLGRRLAWFTCAFYFANGLVGTGLLTSIPQTGLMLFLVGWIAVPPQSEVTAWQPSSASSLNSLAPIPVQTRQPHTA